MKRLPTFKYIDSKYDKESEARKDWESIYDKVNDKENIWTLTKFGKDANAFINHGNKDRIGEICDNGATGSQNCKFSYDYSKIRLSEYKNAVNNNRFLPVYHVKSMENPTVKFNTISYVPSTVYLLDPLANYNKGVLTRGLNGIRNVEDDKFPYMAYNVLPKDTDTYRGYLYDQKIFEGDDDIKINPDRDGDGDRYSQFVIEHIPVQSEKMDILWVIVPMRIIIKDEEEDNGMDKKTKVSSNEPNEPRSQSEWMLRWMLDNWIEKIEKRDESGRMHFSGDVYGSLVELKDVIPKLATSSPYLYIRYFRNGKKHHILHFKEKHIKNAGIQFYVGSLSGLSELFPYGKGGGDDDDVIEQKNASILRYQQFVYFDESEFDSGMEVEVYNGQGDDLIRDKQGVVRSRKGLNMTCKPVEIGGNKYDNSYKYSLVSGEIEKKPSWDYGNMKKYFSGQGRNFGIALMILCLMILLVVVGSFFMTKA